MPIVGYSRVFGGGGSPAAPTLVDQVKGAIAQDGAGGTVTHDITLPAGMQEDDWVLAVLGSDNNLFRSGSGIIQSSGWTTIVLPDSGFGPGRQIAWKVMGPTVDTVLTILRDDGRQTEWCIGAWRGADTTTPLDATTVETTGATGMPDPGSLTTVTNNAIRIIAAILDDDEVVPTAPSGFGDLIHTGPDGGATGADVTVMMASAVAASAGALDPDAFGGAGTDEWAAYHIALRPA